MYCLNSESFKIKKKYLNGRVTQGEERTRERESSSICGSLSDGRNGLGQARAKPGAWNTTCVSHIGDRAPKIWAIFCGFPRGKMPFLRQNDYISI